MSDANEASYDTPDYIRRMLGIKLIEDKKAETYEEIRQMILEYINTHEVDGTDIFVNELFHLINNAELDIKEINSYIYDTERWLK